MHTPLALLLLSLALGTHAKGLGRLDDLEELQEVHPRHQTTEVDYVSTRISVNGELETRLAYKGISAMEVVIPYEGEEGLFYRQISDGRRIVQMLYKGKENLVDCDLSADHEDMQRFFDRFLGADEVYDVQGSARKSNATMKLITGDLEDPLKVLSDFKTHRRQCQAFMKEMMKKVDAKKDASREGLFSNNDVKQESHHRTKRSMFIYPGTKWCGRGSISTHYDDLGDNIATDKCCRDHDHCPYTISGFASDYGYFNYRFHTLSHCNCDESFRACLRAAGNSVANMVGELYFNVVGTKCFKLKKEQQCVERSWWGKCSKYDYAKNAYVQEPLIF